MSIKDGNVKLFLYKDNVSGIDMMNNSNDELGFRCFSFSIAKVYAFCDYTLKHIPECIFLGCDRYTNPVIQ